MPRPIVSDVAEFLYAELAPLTYADEQYDWPLLHWCEAWGLILSELDYIVHSGPNGEPGWSALVDPDLATENTIDYVGQLIGLRFPVGTSFLQKNLKIKDGGNLYRATPRAMAGAVQQFLKGTKTVLLEERDGSAYRFAVAVFENELNNYINDGGFESGLDGWALFQGESWPDAFVDIQRKRENVHSGDYAMRVSFNSVTSAIRKTIIGSFSKGQKITLKFWIYYISNGILKTMFGGVPGNRFSEDISLVGAGGGWAQEQIVREYTLTADVVNPMIHFSTTSSVPWVVNFDDISFKVDDGEYDAVIAAIKPHKYLGGLSRLIEVEVGEDWTYLLLGATRYQRDENDFMQIVLSPYQSYDDLWHYFRNYQHLADNKLEWLDFNNDFGAGDLTNWTASGVWTTAEVISLSEAWQQSPGYVAHVNVASTQDLNLTHDATLIINTGDEYRIKFQKKILSRTADGRVYLNITWLDDLANTIDITSLSASVADSAVGEYAVDHVMTVPTGATQCYLTVRATAPSGSAVDGYVDGVSFKYEPPES